MLKLFNFPRYVVIFILQIALVAGLFIGYIDHSLSAIATTISKRDNYQFDNADIEPTFKNDFPNSQQSGEVASSEESITEKIVDKLNLKESLPPSTKKFIEQVEGKESIGSDPIPPSYQGE